MNIQTLKAHYHDVFDRQWYLTTYPDVAASGMEPIEHFIAHGDAELRKPNQLFSPMWYYDAYLKNNSKQQGPFQHYMMLGRQKGLIPNPTVDEEFF